jgi:hypothetical protein
VLGNWLFRRMTRGEIPSFVLIVAVVAVARLAYLGRCCGVGLYSCGDEPFTARCCAEISCSGYCYDGSGCGLGRNLCPGVWCARPGTTYITFAPARESRSRIRIQGESTPVPRTAHGSVALTHASPCPS